MLRTRNGQPSLWESVLPEICLRLPVELERVDAWLDDDRFFAPFVPHFSTRMGRPSIPLQTYLRLMFLKHRYRLGYESLCAEVSDSISWRRFCRVDIDARLPQPSTLMKLTTRCGEQAIAALNDELLGKAAEARLVKTGKVRADTTVVSANVDYPTDSGRLARAVRRMSRLVTRIRAAGAAPRTPFRDRTRAAGRRVRSIAAHLRLRGAQARDQAQATVARITGELAGLAGCTAADAAVVLRNARRALARVTGRAQGRLRRAINELAVMIERTDRVIAQARNPAGRRQTRLCDPAGQPPRPRRPPDRQGTPRQTRRVRLQGPGRGQRRRHRPGLHRRTGQPTRRPTVGPRGATEHRPDRPGTPRSDRGSRLRPGQCRDRPAHPGRGNRCHPTQRQTRHRPPGV
jgi:IS5 family transposase